MREWALFNTSLVGLDFLIILYGVYLAKVKRDFVRHPKVMIAAGVVFLLFLASFLLKIAVVGLQPFPVWTDPPLGIQPRHILYVHEGVALVTVPLIIATYWLAAKKRFALHKKIAPWAAGLWLFESAFGIVEFFILYPA